MNAYLNTGKMEVILKKIKNKKYIS